MASEHPSTLILASTSAFRRALLDAAGLRYESAAPTFEEREPAAMAPRDVARLFAREKAASISALRPEALVIGSDQTVELGGQLLRKPGSRAAARRQLTALAGRTHLLHAAVALERRAPRLSLVAVETVRMTMLPLSRRELEAYLDTGEWQGCAGGYRIEGQGIKLLESVRGDYHAVIGLPMLRLLKLLRKAGVQVL